VAHADINWVAVMVAAFVAYVLGALWYSPALFAKPWMRLIGVPEGGTIEGAAFATTLIVQAVVTVITSIVVAAIVGWSGANNPVEGGLVGALLGAGLVATDHLKLVAFEKRPFGLFAINNGYTVLAYVIMGAIVGTWH
jgi:hypothetical protein